MLRITRKRSRVLLIALLSTAAIMLIAFGVYRTLRPHDNAQAYLNNFDRGNIISDFVMTNKNTMSEADIQRFLKSKNSCNDRDWNKYQEYTKRGLSYTWRDGHFVCMADEDFNGESAAHIIWQAAQDYTINPQVLIVLLQKEQGLVTDTWPNHNKQYAHATGFGCPDTGNGCDPIYGGFKAQIRNAAKSYRSIMNRPNGSVYYPLGNQYIQFEPNRACGGMTVNIKNKATSALYQYTPYTPNDAALSAGWGKAQCGAYGNRNFYNYFTEWFGSTQGYEVSGSIKERYDQLNGSLGAPIANMVYAGGNSNIWWQEFQYGVIIGSSRTGFWESTGGIRDRWGQLGYQTGSMGFPTGPIVYLGDNSWYQTYEHGAIIGRSRTGFWESTGGIRDRWGQLGYQTGSMGFPTGPVVGNTYQQYDNGFIVGTTQTGYWESRGSIRERWGETGFQSGSMGFPTGPEQRILDKGYKQNYQNGMIAGQAATGYWSMPKAIAKSWQEMGYGAEGIGMPTSEPFGIVYQEFQWGYIIGTPQTGYWESVGAVREIWAKNGYQSGRLGYPTSHMTYEPSTKTWSQNYQHGTITYSDAEGGKVTYR